MHFANFLSKYILLGINAKVLTFYPFVFKELKFLKYKKLMGKLENLSCRCLSVK